MCCFFLCSLKNTGLECRGLARMIVAHNFLEKDKRDPATLEHVEWKKIKKKKNHYFFALVLMYFVLGCKRFIAPKEYSCLGRSCEKKDNQRCI